MLRCALQTAVEVVWTTELGIICQRVSVPVGGFKVGTEALLNVDWLVNLNEKGVDETKSSVGLVTVKLRWGANSKPGAPRGAF